MKQVYANNARTTLAAAITGTSTTISTVGVGVFPTITAGQFLSVTLESAGAIEVVYLVAGSGAAFSVLRGQEGTVAQSFPAGALAEARVSRDTLARMSTTFVQGGTIDALTSPLNSYNEGYICTTLDPYNNPIITMRRNSASWSFLNYTSIGASTVTTGTTTTITTSLSSLVVNAVTSNRYLIQITSGALAGTVRSVALSAGGVITVGSPLPSAPVAGSTIEIYEANSVRFAIQDSEISQRFSGRMRTLTPIGGAFIREWADITTGTVSSTTGAIEYGISYNCDIDAAGNWLGRDVADVCWLEKWTDVGGIKEVWGAATAAAGVIPTWVKVFSLNSQTGAIDTGSGAITTTGAVSAGSLQTAGYLRFPATQVPSAGANDLDDYEEGAWTPTLVGTGCTFSYAGQWGKYTKVGNLVTISASVALNTTGNTLAANALTISGLPFISANEIVGTAPSRWTGQISWGAFTTALVGASINLNSNVSSLALYKVPAAAVTSNASLVGTDLNATGGSSIFLTLTYHTV